jgi:hypothetical protein
MVLSTEFTLISGRDCKRLALSLPSDNCLSYGRAKISLLCKRILLSQ